MITTLDKICSLGGGTGFPDRYQGSCSGDYPFIKVSDMNLVGNERYIRRANNYLNEVDRQELGAKVFQNGATVFAKVGAALNLNRRRQLVKDTLIDNNMMAAIPNRARVLPEYLFYALSRVDLGQISQVGSVPSVNQEQVGSIRVFCPDSLSEQKAIVEILSDCDAAIEFAEQATANAKCKHTVLVNHLMRAFSNRQVPIDQLDLQLMVDGDWVESKDQDPKGEVRLVQTGNVGDGCFIDASSRYMTDAKAKELGCTFLQLGDILISRLPDPIGRACILPDLGQPSVTAVDVCIIRPGNTINRVWLLNAINWKKTRTQMQARAGGSTRQRVSTSEIKKIRLPLVTAEISEQCGRSLSLLQQEIQLQQKRSTLLKQQKRGLMQQLLTGKLRVKGAA